MHRLFLSALLTGQHNPQNTIQLDPPSGTNDGLLIQIDDGKIVAEPVGIPEGTEPPSPEAGRRAVVGTGTDLGAIRENGTTEKENGVAESGDVVKDNDHIHNEEFMD